MPAQYKNRDRDRCQFENSLNIWESQDGQAEPVPSPLFQIALALSNHSSAETTEL